MANMKESPSAQDQGTQQLASSHIVSDPEFEQACRFLILIATQAYRFGVPVPLLESFLTRMPDSPVGLQGEINIAPPAINFHVWRPGATQQHHFVARLPSTSYDLDKLVQIADLMAQFRKEGVTVAEAITRAEQIAALPARYGIPAVGMGYALCGAGIAVLLSAVWSDVILAAILSLVVYALVGLAGKSQWLANRLSLVAALVASILATVAAILITGSNPTTTTISSVIILVPGLLLTQGFAELVAKSILAGLDHIISGVLDTFALVIGGLVGGAVIRFLWTVPPPVTAPAMSAGVIWASVVALLVGLALVFQLHPRDLGWVILGGVIAYAGQSLGDSFGVWQGSFFGALGLGIYANLYALKLRRPNSVVMLPGIMLLVPGVAAYLSVNTLHIDGISSALPAIGDVLAKIMAIIGGLFLAASFEPQKTES